MYVCMCQRNTTKHISAQTCILCSSFSFSPMLKKQRQRVSFILLGIALHLDKCNTAGRMHRWINFRRYNAAMGQTRRESWNAGRGSFMCAIKKELSATGAEETEEIENSPVVWRMLYRCVAYCVDAAHNFGKNINRNEPYMSVRDSRQCAPRRTSKAHWRNIKWQSKKNADYTCDLHIHFKNRFTRQAVQNPPLNVRKDVRVYVSRRQGPFNVNLSFPRVNRGRTQDGNYGTPLHATRQVDRYFHVGEKYVTNPTLTSSGFRSRSLVQRYISYIARGASFLLHVPHFPTSFHILWSALEANVTRSLKTYTKASLSQVKPHLINLPGRYRQISSLETGSHRNARYF